MKKSSVKKLTLGKETITQLQQRDLKEAGGVYTADGASCYAPFTCPAT